MSSDDDDDDDNDDGKIDIVANIHIYLFYFASYHNYVVQL